MEYRSHAIIIRLRFSWPAAWQLACPLRIRTRLPASPDPPADLRPEYREYGTAPESNTNNVIERLVSSSGVLRICNHRLCMSRHRHRNAFDGGAAFPVCSWERCPTRPALAVPRAMLCAVVWRQKSIHWVGPQAVSGRARVTARNQAPPCARRSRSSLWHHPLGRARAWSRPRPVRTSPCARRQTSAAL